MTEQTSEEFDFNDWAGLYMESPQEFEARRTAALMIELTRGTPEQCAAGRAMLESFERRVKNCDAQQRFEVAASMMAESASQLRTELMVLIAALSNKEETDEA